MAPKKRPREEGGDHPPTANRSGETSGAQAVAGKDTAQESEREQNIRLVKSLFRELHTASGSGADGADGEGLTGYIRPTGVVDVLTALGVKGKKVMDFGAHIGRSGPFFPEFRHVPRCSRAGSNYSAYTRRHGHTKSAIGDSGAASQPPSRRTCRVMLAALCMDASHVTGTELPDKCYPYAAVWKGEWWGLCFVLVSECWVPRLDGRGVAGSFPSAGNAQFGRRNFPSLRSLHSWKCKPFLVRHAPQVDF